MATFLDIGGTGAGSASPLDHSSILEGDSTRQIDEVLSLPQQLRDALDRAEAAGATPVDASGGVIVAGMGGSGVGGRLALAALGPQLTRPLLVSNDYSLPGWAG